MFTTTVATTMESSIEVHTSEACFEDPRWRELLAGDVDRHVFAMPEWNRVWWEEFGGGKELFVLTLEGEDGPLAIVPLYRKIEDGRRILRFVGGIDLTDYLGPICGTQDRARVADQLVSWLSQTDVEWDEFDAHNMPVPFGFAEFLVERVDSAGLAFTLEQEETSAVLLLPDEWEAYLRGLDSKDRHELRRKRRRIEREHPDPAVRTATEDTLDQDLKMFVEMHRGAEGHKGHFMKPEIATFFDRVTRAFAPLGWLRIHLLEIGERPVGSAFSFEIDGAFYLYNSAYEPDVARLSPGLVLVSELVKDCVERGLKRFDFLRGPERYKYQLGAQAVPLNHVRVLSG